MGSGEKIKYQGMSETEMAEFFREIADRLEGREPDEPKFPFDPSGFRKLKISVKRQMDGLSVKVKMKPSYSLSPLGETDLPPELEGQKPKYKKLKKRMKVTFKAIQDSLAAGTLPNGAAVTSFMEDSRLMIDYPGYGDEYYQEYDQACLRFQEACDRQDIETCKVACQELDRLKKACHDKYK